MQHHYTTLNYQWLLDRGITPQSLREFNISWEGGHITIPIYAANGDFLFNKYRVSPAAPEQKPKYWYDKGANVGLFGIQSLVRTNKYREVIICEGELDALLLISKGFAAVSTTGGSSSFLDEWLPLFQEKHVFICYDKDDAGLKGSLLVQKKLPHARIMTFPDVGFIGKDVTDLLGSNNGTEILKKMMNEAITLPMPEPVPELSTKKAYNDLIKKYRTIVDTHLMPRALYLREHNTSDRREQMVIEMFCAAVDNLIRRRNKLGRNKQAMDGGLLEAKQVPITEFLEFERRFAKCIWHEDNNPSMYYYPSSNRVKCFACGEHGDVVDVIQKKENLNLPQAISFILNK